MRLHGGRKYGVIGGSVLIIFSAIVGFLIAADIIRFREMGENIVLNFSVNGSNLKFGSLDANDRYVSFTLKDTIGSGPPSIFIYNYENTAWAKINAPTSYSIGGNFSRINKNIFFFSAGEVKPEKNLTTKVYKCNLEKNKCTLLFSIEDPAHSFVDFLDGRLLFVSSTPESGGAGMPFRYKKWDFYLRFPDEKIQKLTDLQLYSIGSLNLTKHGLFINAYGGKNLGYPIGKESEIYRLDFNNSDNQINVASFLKTPFITYNEPIVSSPSILPESDFIAFYSRSWGRSELEFKKQIIVIHDLVTGETLDEYSFEGYGKLSGPVMIDNENLLFSIIDEDKMNVFKRNFVKKKNTQILSAIKADLNDYQVREIIY